MAKTRGGKRQKSRRLQVWLAYQMAKRFRLTIEAEPPTKPGKKDGVVWVIQPDGPDLKVRRQGEPGPDVEALTARAKVAVRLGPLVPYFECKNDESFRIDAHYWVTGTCAILRNALDQCEAQLQHHTKSRDRVVPVIVLARNEFPPVAFLPSWALREIPGLPQVRPLLWTLESALGIRPSDLMGLMNG